MKFGVRTPSPSKSLSARTTGKANRAVKKAFDPSYGRKGTGVIKNPKRAAYNKIYSKTTYSAYGKRSRKRSGNSEDVGCLTFLIIIVLMVALYINPVGTVFAVVIGGPILLVLTPIIIIVGGIIYGIGSLVMSKKGKKKDKHQEYISPYMPDEF